MNSVYIHNYYIHHMLKLYVQTSCTHNVFFLATVYMDFPSCRSVAPGLKKFGAI